MTMFHLINVALTFMAMVVTLRIGYKLRIARERLLRAQHEKAELLKWLEVLRWGRADCTWARGSWRWC